VRRAVAVAVIRTGGGQGGQSVFSIVGAGNAANAEVLALASTPAFQALRPRYGPVRPALARYIYRIEAGYQDNTKKVVIVVDGTPGTPRVALNVIRLMTNMAAVDMSTAFPPGFPFD
jgi:hypothetical protein